MLLIFNSSPPVIYITITAVKLKQWVIFCTNLQNIFTQEAGW